MRVPPAFAGIASVLSSIRRPVAVLGSATV